MEADRASLDRLKKVPLFAGCTDEGLQKILSVAADFEVQPGHVLVERGQPGAGLFVIDEGTVVVELPHRKIELGEGEFFGELALLDSSGAHKARVHADTAVHGIAISRDAFEELLHSHPEVTFGMLQALARRLGDSATI
jgi:CRP-like cAMP-binding protein